MEKTDVELKVTAARQMFKVWRQTQPSQTQRQTGRAEQ